MNKLSYIFKTILLRPDWPQRIQKVWLIADVKIWTEIKATTKLQASNDKPGLDLSIKINSGILLGSVQALHLRAYRT